MKRFTILLLSLMTLGMYAQSPMTISTNFSVTYGTGYPKGETMIWEAKYFDEDDDPTTLGVWTDSNPQVVANPDKEGINKNDKCLKLTCADTDGFFKMHLPSGFNLNGRRRISMLYKGMGKEFYAQLELVDEFTGGGSNTWKLGAYQDVDGWKRLYFDFTPYDEGTGSGYINVADEPDVLVFKPKIKDKNYAIQNSTKDDVYYIDEIKVEDVPYAEGYWIHDNTHWPKGTFDASATPKWNTEGCQLPTNSNGVLHLSGTWLKGRNIVNPDKETENIESDPKGKAGYWVYEFNEYRDLSWHVKPDKVKLMVFHKDAKLRWPDRGGLLGTNTGTPEAAQGYPDRFIENLNVLIFAEKSCILPDEKDNLEAHWHDTNAVVHYGSNVWKTWDLELTDDYPFLNPQQFTVQNTIKLHRTMKPGFNTITYPFYVTAAELQSARVGSLYFGMNDENLLFVTASQTEPNKPYITDKFKPLCDGEINVTETYQQINLSAERPVLTVDENYTGYSSDATSGKLYGTYKRIPGKDKWAIVTDGSWQGFMQGGEGSSIKPFRGYLDILPNAASAGARSLSILDDDATGMGTGMVNGIETVETIHDLQGRAIKAGSLSSLPKGIYIINGKKTMIK